MAGEEASFLVIMQSVLPILDIFTDLVVIFVVGAIALFLYRTLSPAIRLQVEPRWAGAGVVILRLQVENVSRVVITDIEFLLQAIPYEVDKWRQMSEWVPLEEKKVREDEPVTPWREPAKVFTTTVALNPGERVVGERMMECPNGCFLHIAFQVRKPGEPRRRGDWLASWPRRWTTTLIVEQPPDRAK